MAESTNVMRALAAFLVVAGLAIGGVVSAPAAHAASGNLEVSPDGASYAKTYPGVLFDDIALLVPGDAQGETLYLRNSGDADGYLRVVLEDVTYSDLDFANALTLQATVAGTTGPKTAISLAQPCWVLVEGAVIAAGAVVRLDTSLELGNLDGLLGQGATARVSLSASLSDTTPGSVSPSECGRSDVVVPVLPGTGRGTGPTNPGDPAARPAQSEIVSSPGDLPVLALPGGIIIDPNTWQLFEEWLVLLLFGALAMGAGWFVLMRRRRHDRTPSPDAETEVVS